MSLFSQILKFISANWWALLFLALLLILKLFLPQIKGFFGEKNIAARLSQLPSEEYLVLHDILLESKDKTSQIDHVVVSAYGIFVIETKNYQGLILGQEKDGRFMQILHKNKYPFLNPILQNKGHIQALEVTLEEFLPLHFISIVAFSDDCTLKVESNNVVYFSEVTKRIRQYEEKTINPVDMHKIYYTLKSKNIQDPARRKEHVEKIKEKRQAK